MCITSSITAIRVSEFDFSMRGADYHVHTLDFRGLVYVYN